MPTPVDILKRPPPRLFTAWSFSRWKDHSDPVSGCPRRARLKHLDKLPEGETSPAMARGGAIHKEAEDFVKGLVKKLPATLLNFAAEFKLLRQAKALAEGKWGLDVRWQPVGFTDWVRCWCRVVLDAHFRPDPQTARVIDYKTGKVYGDNAEQLELYAVAGFAYYPDVERVETELWYLDQGLILPEKASDRVYVKKKELAALQKKWRERAIPLLTDKKFVPRPGAHCGRCAYSKARSGPCEF